VRMNGDLGLKGSLPVGETLRLAATFDVTYGPALSILVAQGLVDAINSGEITPAEFFREYETVTGIVGLVGSWAPQPFLGFTLNGRFLMPSKSGKSVYAQNGAFAGAMADFDARPIWPRFPLGLSAAYTVTTPTGGSGGSTLQEFGLGVNYTGRRDLGLGVQLERKLGRLANGMESRATLAWLDLKYYWE
jgi:hypothetical protein